MKTLIYNGHVIDPANHVDGKLNILIEDGKIAGFGEMRTTPIPEGCEILDAEGSSMQFNLIEQEMLLAAKKEIYK